jgi:hypothetical protein
MTGDHDPYAASGIFWGFPDFLDTEVCATLPPLALKLMKPETKSMVYAYLSKDSLEQGH